MKTNQVMTVARFWNKVKIIPEANSDACWEWQGGTMPNGYGVASIGESKTQLAHRFAASLSQDIKNQIVRHKCDNPLCVRPDHLEVGTQQENISDMINKERKHTKLYRQAVLDIRTKQLSRPEYALKYGVTIGTIGDVQRRQVWRHI
jgi:hypothetical protein